VIAGAGSALAQHGARLDEATRLSLARSVETKAREMSELVSNVLDLVRFESGQTVLRRDWQTLDDLVGSALAANAEKLAGHPLEVQLAADLPQVYVDATLIVQVFANLFDNISKYTPSGTRVIVSAQAESTREFVRVTVDDEGPGLPAGDPARLFDKFHRGSGEGSVAGVGLAICQAIVRAHGGEIEAQRRAGGGARFSFTLPATEGTPP
jgi:two-component system, OmpR family, sensor histidine kinase KdpD